MSETWEFYECSIEDQRAFVALDLSFYDRAPIAELPHEVRVTVHMENPRDDGLNTAEERPALDAVEDKLKIAFEGIGGVYVGRATFGGARRHYFYVPTMDQVEEAFNQVTAAAGERKIDGDGFEDPEWTQYLEFLYPNSKAWQYINDRRVVQTLQEHGDDTSKPRNIDHFAYFATAAARDSFVEELRERGMTIDGTDKNEEGDLPYTVSFSQSLAPIEIFTVTCELQGLAESLDGDYDGWGCAIAESE